MKRLLNRNVLIIFALLAVVAIMIIAGQRLQPTASSQPDTSQKEQFYLLATVGGVLYRPIPLTEENQYTIKQSDSIVNVIHVTEDSIWMESSTCENQNCVEQGIVNHENRASRLLGNMIICLPNLVQLELYSESELITLGLLEDDE